MRKHVRNKTKIPFVPVMIAVLNMNVGKENATRNKDVAVGAKHQMNDEWTNHVSWNDFYFKLHLFYCKFNIIFIPNFKACHFKFFDKDST